MEIAEFERNIAQSKANIAFGAAIERLKTNRDFKEVVSTGYFEKEAVRLVHLMGSPHMQTPEKQASIVRDLAAISGFSEYLNTGLFKAELAAKSLPDTEEALAEMLQEQAAA